MLLGNEAYPEKSSVLPDEKNDASLKLPVEQCSTLLHGSLKQELKQASEVYMNLRSKHFPNPHQIPLIEDITKSQEVESLAHLQSVKPDGQQIVSDVKLNQESEGENPCSSLEHNAKLVESAAPGLSSYNNLRETTEKTNELQSKTGLWNSLIASSHQSTGEKFSLTKESNVSSFSMLSNAQVSAHQNQIYRMGNANVNAAKVHANLAQKPFDVHNKDGVLPAVNYASGPVQSEGQQTSIGAGNTGAVFICSSQLPVNENIPVGKSSINKFRASNGQHKASSMLGIPTFEPNLSKQFGNIHEMTKELDVLLRSIEEAGGFRDTCTRSLLSSVEALEQRMETLSDNCKLWTFQVDEQLEEVYHLLDKTVQVVARKMYMEGVFNQASDRRYWDLWNQQKLNSELELKQQHILSLNQDLTNQLIELEGHFNVLELNKFSEYGGTHVGHGATQSRYRPSRYIQSLYSVHNAVNSQLVAAENLSECLSKQMTALSVKSPSDEQKNVKMELFETIGIPYEPSFGSPDMKGVVNTPSTKPVFSDLITNKDRSKKHQACTIKGCEPEMSRRRRDSLDQSWTCFEPPKTIVRRMLLQEVKRPNLNTSLFSMDKENISLFMLERSPHQIDSRIPATMFPETDKKAAGIQVAPPEEVSEHSKALIWDNHLSTLTQHSVNSESWRKLDFPFSASSTIPAASTLLGKVTQSNVRKSPPSEKISALLTFGGSFESPSPTIQTSMASPLSSSVSSEMVPSPAVSVDLSRSLTSSNTSIDTNQIRPASSAPESPSLLIPSLILSNPTAKHTLSSFPHPSSVNSNLEVLKPEVQQVFISNLKTDLDADKDVSTLKIETPKSESKLRLEPAGKCSPTSVSSSGGLSNNIKSSAPNIISVSRAEQPIDAPMQFSTSFPASASVTTGKIESLDAGITGEDEMEEEAPEISNTTEPSLGSFSGFGIGSLSHPSTPKSNPFGGSFSNGETSLTSSTITFSVPSGELFRPASFTFPSSEYSAPALSTNSGVFSGGISAGTTVSATTQSVFGQPSQVGSGQQALGSVLGTFGQSRQLGSGLPGSGFGGGFAVSNSSSGFSSAATGGGFAGVSGGGFSGIASTFGGFAGGASVGARSAGGGFAAVSSAGGFAGAASGGFGAFSSQGSGGFAAFGTSGGTSKPPELFTQMRK